MHPGVEDAQMVVDEYGRRLGLAMGEIVALTVALKKEQKASEMLRRRLEDIAKDNGDE